MIHLQSNDEVGKGGWGGRVGRVEEKCKIQKPSVSLLQLKCCKNDAHKNDAMTREFKKKTDCFSYAGIQLQ